MADVFVSYKTEDRALAESVITLLDVAGFTVWWDQRLTPREAWDDLIKQEIDAARAVLVLWTLRSIGSEWVRIEADYAKELGKLVPVKLEACGLPFAFRLRQTFDLTTWDGSETHPEWKKTLQFLGELVGEPSKKAEQRIAEQQAWRTQADAMGEEIAHLRAEVASLRQSSQQVVVSTPSDETIQRTPRGDPGSAVRVEAPAVTASAVIQPPTGAEAKAVLERKAAEQRTRNRRALRFMPMFAISDTPLAFFYLSALSQSNLLPSTWRSFFSRVPGVDWIAQFTFAWVTVHPDAWPSLSQSEVVFAVLLLAWMHTLAVLFLSDLPAQEGLGIGVSIFLTDAFLIGLVVVFAVVLLIFWILPTTLSYVFGTSAFVVIALLIFVSFVEEPLARSRLTVLLCVWASIGFLSCVLGYLA